MSGGGGKVSRGRMSSKLVNDLSPQQLAELEQKLRSKQKALQVIKLNCKHHTNYCVNLCIV